MDTMKALTRLVATALCCLAAPQADADALRARVSDIAQAPVRDIFRASPINVELAVENGTMAMESVRAGKADLAVVAIPVGESLPQDLDCAPFAFEVATVVVNDINPLKKTDLTTLAAALSASTQDDGKWALFGMKDAWADRNILIYLPDSSFGITLPLLRSQTLRHDAIRENAVYMTQRDSADVFIREQSSSLMVIRGINIPQNAHALELAIDKGKDSFAYPPSESSVFYGDYPLRLPFYIVTRKDGAKPAANVKAFLLSDAVAEKLAAAGYIPVLKSERANGE